MGETEAQTSPSDMDGALWDLTTHELMDVLSLQIKGRITPVETSLQKKD